MVATKPKLMTAADLLRLHGEGVRGELIRGEFHELMSAGREHGQLVMKLGWLIQNFTIPRRLGRVYGSDSGVLLERDPDTVREPDIGFISTERDPKDARITGYDEQVPDLAVEIASPSDSGREIREKALMWKRYGARIAWAVFPDARTVDVYGEDGSVITLIENDVLDGGRSCPASHAKWARYSTFRIRSTKMNGAEVPPVVRHTNPVLAMLGPADCDALADSPSA